MAAAHHMNEALERLPSGLKLPKRLRAQIALMRHTIEHWDDQSARTGRWQTLADEHGEHATPWLVVGMDTDIEIGPADISLDGLERLLELIRDELLEIYPGMPWAIQSDAVDRAVAAIWDEQLALNNEKAEADRSRADASTYRPAGRAIPDRYRRRLRASGASTVWVEGLALAVWVGGLTPRADAPNRPVSTGQVRQGQQGQRALTVLLL
jgi:hypothetical protein